MTAPLMPKATAVWLVENTALTFRQIAAFCELHELEIQAIADGDVAYNIIGISPVANNQLTLEEIKRCEADPAELLVANVQETNVKAKNTKNKKLLSPSQRNDKPAAILWIIRNCPEIIDSQICKLIGTTKPTINSIREGTHRDMPDLRPKNPVAIGLCNEKDLENAIAVSQARTNPKPRKKVAKKKTVKKKVAKKASAKKTTVKKAATKKATKKTTTKKTAVKKASSEKKTASAKIAKKKATAKKAGTKTVGKKATVKAEAKKVTKKKSPAKKAETKKVSAKKQTTKRVATKKSPTKKSVTKKSAKADK